LTKINLAGPCRTAHDRGVTSADHARDSAEQQWSEQDPQHKMAEEFAFQAAGCEGQGSLLYRDLMAQCAADIRAGGVVWDTVRVQAGMRFGLALPLRFVAAVHRLALTGHAPALAAHYPSCGGSPGSGLWDAFAATVATHQAQIADELTMGVQTNEVVRSAALFPGLATIAGRTGLPLSLREIGTSAGLNLRMDNFRYTQGEWVDGDPLGAVVIADRWPEGTPKSSALTIRAQMIADRAGCDPDPIDPTTPDESARSRRSSSPVSGPLALNERTPTPGSPPNSRHGPQGRRPS
jgi:hypothetical protein